MKRMRQRQKLWQLMNALGDAIRDVQRDCESENKAKFERMLEDHGKLLYPTAEDRQKKVGYNT